MMCVLRPRICILSAIASAVAVSDRSDVNPGLSALAARAVEFVWADIDQGGGIAVISMFEDDYILATRVRASHPQCKFVGLAAGVHKKADAQRLGQEPRQPLGVEVNIVVEIARVGIEQCHL